MMSYTPRVGRLVALLALCNRAASRASSASRACGRADYRETMRLHQRWERVHAALCDEMRACDTAIPAVRGA